MPDELLLDAYPIGTHDMVAKRVQAIADAGVDAIRVGPTGRTTAEKIEHLEMTVDLVASAS